ncbi:unnamed protein product [Paramecium primaurelia]|uniref:NADH:flavin oxidoreductase/NADH oxidase N-terminal domain-containing protein n=1 Tax=Paramecium primaurelia TaxID=5886 RepID=A0A8S1JR17_PARPR|nr:unnamed protein product [Paramecium primaurelia]
MNNTSILFKSLKLGELTIPNRIIMAAMTRMRCDNETKVPNNIVADYYSQRASAGLILTECTLVSQRSNAFPGCAGILNEEQVEGWKKVIDAVHKKNGRIALQIWHSGRATHSNLQGGQIPWAPSPIAINGVNYAVKQPHEVPHEMTIEDIKLVIQQFKEGAYRAKKAGFDAIELHGANGYLVDQFLRSHSNKRNDLYGGSVENRSRFCLEVIDELIQVFGKGRVGLKVSPLGRYNDMFDEDPIKLYTYLFKELDKRQIAFIEIMNSKDEDNCYGYGHPASEKQVPNLLQQLRPSFKGVIIGNVGLTALTAAQGIEQGLFDAASFGTLYIGNPDLVERFKDNLKLSDSDPKKYFGGNHEGYSDYPPFQG